jgi:TolB protein
MNQTIRKTVKWLLCGGAFVAVIAITGCSRRSNVARTVEPISDPYRAPAESTELFDKSDTAEASAPTVNIFGELDGKAQENVKQLSEAGFQQHTFVDEGYDANVSVSPDGKWLVFASTRHSEHPDIYLQHADGQSVIQLTADESDDAYPTFSPDGKHIAFCSTRNGSWDIYTMDVDGKNVTQVTSGPAQDLHPSFSPDGKRLVYSSMGPRSNQWEIWTVSLATGEKKMIAFGLFPNWSPDKSVDRIAFQRARQRGSRWFSLWTLDLIDGEARRMTEVAMSTNAAIVAPCWSTDGNKLAFGTIVDPAREKGDQPEGQQDIWTVNADGSNKQRLTDGTASNLSPVWANGGRIFFISNRGGNECVWSAKADVEVNTAVTATDPKEGH